MTRRPVPLEEARGAANGTARLNRGSRAGAEPAGVVRLHASESPYGASPAALAAVADELERMHLYPDPGADELVRAIAVHYGVSRARVSVANGLDEMILFLVLALGGPDRPGVTTEATFQSYGHSLTLTGTPSLRCPLDGYRISADRLSRRLRAGSAFALVCNPHNPCGTTLGREELHELHEAAIAGGGVLIVDEAYAEYAGDDFYSMLPLAGTEPRICVLRTFSKAYGLAGLRIGYAIGDEEVIRRVNEGFAAAPFHVNRLAQHAAIAALADQSHLDWTRREVIATRERFRADLEALGVVCPRSQTNFLLARVGPRGSAIARQLAAAGFEVRDAAELGFPGHLRISVGAPAEMDALRDALAGLLERPDPPAHASVATSLFTAYATASAVSAAVEIGLLDAVHSQGTLDVRTYADDRELHRLTVDAVAKLLVEHRILETLDAESRLVRPGSAFADVWSNKGYLLWLVRGYGEMLSRAGELTTESDRSKVTALRDGAAIAKAGKDYGTQFVDPFVETILAELGYSVLADLGCGSANRIIELARSNRNARFVGVELDGGAVDVARRAVSAAGLDDRIRIVRDDARRLRARPELDAIDVVTSFFLGHEFWPREDCLETLGQIRRRLPRARHFLLSDTYRSTTERERGLPIFTAGFELTHALMGQELPTADDWIELFEQSAWRLEGRTPLGIPFSEVFHLVPRR